MVGNARPEAPSRIFGAADVSATSVTLAGRRAAESLMLDMGKALRPTGGTTYDPVTQTEVEATGELFGPVRCKVQARNLQPRESEVGGRTSVSVRTELHLPADSPPLRVGDLWEFVSVHPLSLAVVGQRLRVLAPVAGTLKTAARYEVEEVLS